jgi:hypothetical protein
MNLLKSLLACLFLLGINLSASAAPDPAQYRLTDEMLLKLQATDDESKRLQAAARKSRPGGKEHDDEEDEEYEEDEEDEEEDDRADAKGKDDDSVEGIARKIDADPKIKALLAKHGISSMDYALSMHAMLHAGMFLMFESSMPKPKADELFNGYTKAQQANIELLRKSTMMKK